MATIPLFNLRRFDTHRLLPAKYSPNYDSVLTRIADNDEHLQLIFELDNATNDRLQAEENLRPRHQRPRTCLSRASLPRDQCRFYSR